MNVGVEPRVLMEPVCRWHRAETWMGPFVGWVCRCGVVLPPVRQGTPPFFGDVDDSHHHAMVELVEAAMGVVM